MTEVDTLLVPLTANAMSGSDNNRSHPQRMKKNSVGFESGPVIRCVSVRLG